MIKKLVDNMKHNKNVNRMMLTQGFAADGGRLLSDHKGSRSPGRGDTFRASSGDPLSATLTTNGKELGFRYALENQILEANLDEFMTKKFDGASPRQPTSRAAKSRQVSKSVNFKKMDALRQAIATPNAKGTS
jgi:hypothetical protein